MTVTRVSHGRGAHRMTRDDVTLVVGNRLDGVIGNRWRESCNRCACATSRFRYVAGCVGGAHSRRQCKSEQWGNGTWHGMKRLVSSRVLADQVNNIRMRLMSPIIALSTIGGAPNHGDGWDRPADSGR